MTEEQSDDIAEEVLRWTRWLRNGNGPEEAALACEILRMGVDPATAVLAEYFHDDTNFFYGLLVTRHGYVYQFGIDWPSDGTGSSCWARGHMTEWVDKTATWTRSPFREEIEAARQLARTERGEDRDLGSAGAK